jgi:hypothetical protein
VTEDEEDPSESADASFLLGHLALLFGILMMDSPQNQTSIIAALPPLIVSGSGNLPASKQLKLNRLVEQVHELGEFYSVVRRHHSGEADTTEGEGREGWTLDGGELGRGEEVAYNVKRFLEELRSDMHR